ncbi:hypothetical protein [Naasia sp. SYSU D00948]|uniref:hypothetical protein n=1 Tax=Naasia sp. SYSU D00948 TaxID=2817379 RepID=UPI001B306642|nr:hypothetical protein [Naasia sp. SYSU D00948]
MSPLSTVQHTSTVEGTPRPGLGPLAAAVVYTAAWVLGLTIPAEEGRASDDPVVASASLVDAFPLPVVQALLVHGVAGVALYILVVRSLRAWGIARTAKGRTIAVLGAAAGGLSAGQFAVLLVASATAAADPDLTHRLLALIDEIDVAKLLVLAALVVTLPLAYRSAGGRSRWILPFSGIAAALLLVGASSFIAPTPPTSLALGASLVALLVWSIAVATLAPRLRTPNA